MVPKAPTHPPFPHGIETMDTIDCRGDASLGRLVARHPEIEHVLAADYQRPIFVRWAGTIGVAVPSTAHQVALDLRPGEPTRFVTEAPTSLVYIWQPGLFVTTHFVAISDFGAFSK